MIQGTIVQLWSTTPPRVVVEVDGDQSTRWQDRHTVYWTDLAGHFPPPWTRVEGWADGAAGADHDANQDLFRNQPEAGSIMNILPKTCLQSLGRFLFDCSAAPWPIRLLMQRPKRNETLRPVIRWGEVQERWKRNKREVEGSISSTCPGQDTYNALGTWNKELFRSGARY